MRHLFGAFAAAGLLATLAGPVCASGAWTTFHDPAGHFTMQTPSAPSVSHTPVKGPDGGPVDMLAYGVDLGNSEFLVFVIDLTRYPNIDIAQRIGVTVSGVKGAAAQVLSDAPVQLDGQAGREVMVITKQGNHVDERVFVVLHRLYQVMTLIPAAPTAAESADASRYRASFHFTGK